ncbi:MAG: type II toxin-antitoxin system VapC family toxin [Chloroflexi bacterium]|nr:type II toxin-antitoxin system VapC family toxin [Chloroflexota bacterium]
MITAIDTNVLLDVLGAEPPFAMASFQAIEAARRIGSLIACEVVWSETAAWFESAEQATLNLAGMGINYDPLDAPGAAQAGIAWRRYRSAGGPRSRLLADFLVGAHASTRADRLLTRDRGFYRRYFQDLIIIDPSRA